MPTRQSSSKTGRPKKPNTESTVKGSGAGKESTQSSSPKTTSTLSAKEKARWSRIRRVYGISKEQYDELNEGSCPLCLREFDSVVRPVVDHDHSTGEVRGVLCGYCNHRILGRHRDADLLDRMAHYLRRPRKGWVVPPKKKRKRRAKRNDT